jgi:hypothetical protein
VTEAKVVTEFMVDYARLHVVIRYKHREGTFDESVCSPAAISSIAILCNVHNMLKGLEWDKELEMTT